MQRGQAAWKLGPWLLAFALAACDGGAASMPPLRPLPPPTNEPPPAPPPPSSAPAASSAAPSAPPPPKPAKKPLAELEEATLEAYVEGFGDADAIAALYADDGEVWVPGVPPAKGRDAVRAFHHEVLDANAGLDLAVSRAWMAGDAVAAEWVASGLQRKAWMGIAPAQRRWSVVGASLLVFTPEGKIASDHRYIDLATIRAQLGLSRHKARAHATRPDALVLHAPHADALEADSLGWRKAMDAALDAHDATAFADLVSDDAVHDDVTVPVPTRGKGALVRAFEAFTRAMPDATRTPTRTFAVEDFVVQEYALTGTPKAGLSTPLGPAPAMTKPVTEHALEVVRVREGKMTAAWTYANAMELAEQVGLGGSDEASPMPPPKPTHPKARRGTR